MESYKHKRNVIKLLPSRTLEEEEVVTLLLRMSSVIFVLIYVLVLVFQLFFSFSFVLVFIIFSF